MRRWVALALFVITVVARDPEYSAANKNTHDSSREVTERDDSYGLDWNRNGEDVTTNIDTVASSKVTDTVHSDSEHNGSTNELMADARTVDYGTMRAPSYDSELRTRRKRKNTPKASSGSKKQGIRDKLSYSNKTPEQKHSIKKWGLLGLLGLGLGGTYLRYNAENNLQQAQQLGQIPQFAGGGGFGTPFPAIPALPFGVRGY